jgi:hypothetical protein
MTTESRRPLQPIPKIQDSQYAILSSGLHFLLPSSARLRVIPS